MVNIDWGNAENSLLVWKPQRSWKASESNEAWKIILYTLTESKPISVMIDLRHCYTPITFLLHLQAQMEIQMPDNLPIIVVITLPEFLDLLSNENRYPTRMQVVTDVDHAYQLVDLDDAAV